MEGQDVLNACQSYGRIPSLPEGVCPGYCWSPSVGCSEMARAGMYSDAPQELKRSVAQEMPLGK